MCKICLKLMVKVLERRRWRRSGIFTLTDFTHSPGTFIVEFEKVNTDWIKAIFVLYCLKLNQMETMTLRFHC